MDDSLLNVYVFKEFTDYHKVYYSFFTQKFSFFLYYQPDKDEIIYSHTDTKLETKLRKLVLDDTTLFIRKVLIKERNII